MTKEEQAIITAAIRLDWQFAGKSYYVNELDVVSETVDTWIASLPCNADMPDKHVPFAVKKAVIRKFCDDLPLAKIKLETLGGPYFSGYYGFEYAGMFHGVEPDGYIHT